MKERKTRRSHTNSRDGMLFLYLSNFFFAEIKKLGKHYGLRKKKKRQITITYQHFLRSQQPMINLENQ